MLKRTLLLLSVIFAGSLLVAITAKSDNQVISSKEVQKMNKLRNKILDTLTPYEINIVNEFIKDLENGVDIYTISISDLKDVIEDYKDNHKHLDNSNPHKCGKSVLESFKMEEKSFNFKVTTYYNGSLYYKFGIRCLE